MMQSIASIALLVADYDEAIAFYVEKLRFELVEDTSLGEDKRWVIVAPPDAAAGCQLILARAVGEEQERAVGNQAGGRVFLFLTTDDFQRDYQQMKDAGVRFCEAPRHEPYGTVAVFEDLYGNRWDLIERA